jgi:hypothetical protein
MLILVTFFKLVLDPKLIVEMELDYNNKERTLLVKSKSFFLCLQPLFSVGNVQSSIELLSKILDLN